MDNSTSVDIVYLDIQLKRLVDIVEILKGDVKYLRTVIARYERQGVMTRFGPR